MAPFNRVWVKWANSAALPGVCYQQAYLGDEKILVGVNAIAGVPRAGEAPEGVEPRTWGT